MNGLTACTYEKYFRRRPTPEGVRGIMLCWWHPLFVRCPLFWTPSPANFVYEVVELPLSLEMPVLPVQRHLHVPVLHHHHQLCRTSWGCNGRWQCSMPHRQRLQHQFPLDEPRYALVARGYASNLGCCQVRCQLLTIEPVDLVPPWVAGEHNQRPPCVVWSWDWQDPPDWSDWLRWHWLHGGTNVFVEYIYVADTACGLWNASSFRLSAIRMVQVSHLCKRTESMSELYTFNLVARLNLDCLPYCWQSAQHCIRIS